MEIDSVGLETYQETRDILSYCPKLTILQLRVRHYHEEIFIKAVTLLKVLYGP